MKHTPRFTAVALALEAMAPAIALEEAATGEANQERELVYYAKLAENHEVVLKQAVSREHHEQWELRVDKTDENATAGRFRVRKTTPVGDDAGEAEYVLTSKTKLPDGSGETEVAVPSSEAQFNQFKAMSPRGMIKTRYTFDIPGRVDKWEIDTFIDQRGNPSPWVKIDLEITDGNFTRPPFPVGLLDETTVITNSMKSSLVHNVIRELYEDVFITKNQVTYAAVEKVPEVEAPPHEPETAAEAA